VTPWNIADRNRTPEATRIHVPEVQPGQRIFVADQELVDNNPEEALPMAATARAQLGTNFEPSPYYYEATALLKMGQIDQAIEILTEAETKLDNLDGVRSADEPFYRTLIDLGFAEVYLQQAKNALDIADRATAETLLADARERANAAIEHDQYGEGLRRHRRDYQLEGNYEDAIAILDEAQTRPARSRPEHHHRQRPPAAVAGLQRGGWGIRRRKRPLRRRRIRLFTPSTSIRTTRTRTSFAWNRRLRGAIPAWR
jgi:tetratricopeptide (TPR) repeat protein